MPAFFQCIPDSLSRWVKTVKPEIFSISGKVLEVKTGTCEDGTGRSPLGTHFLMKTKEGETLNIHLGPASQVELLVADLSAGTKVKVEGFRTEKMKMGHYVAQTIAYGDRTVAIRDESLQPIWARAQGGRNAAAGAGAAFDWGRGRGADFGYGRGCGYGGG
ncbi:MAG: hypothetical protein GXY83_38270 [Rhodopirellula sp.]|nr:hypothetical protein [Rhodopirellula sp.]